MRNKIHSFSYHFVKPGGGKNVHNVAKRLMRIEKVREVVITEGEYGFIVKSEPLYDNDEDMVGIGIAKVVGGHSKKAMSHCIYSKR